MRPELYVSHYGVGGYEGMQSGPLPIDIRGMNWVILVEEIWCSYEKHTSTIFCIC